MKACKIFLIANKAFSGIGSSIFVKQNPNFCDIALFLLHSEWSDEETTGYLITFQNNLAIYTEINLKLDI